MQKPFLKRVYLEITNVCNLTCPFCPKTKRKPQFMTEAEFRLSLAKLQGHTTHLYFHVLGEPLLHPELNVFLKLAHQAGYKVNLVTNGSLIAQLGPTLLKAKSLRQISFSLHNLAHQGSEVTQQRLREILHFVDLAAKQDIYCSLRLWTGSLAENKPVIDALSKHFALNSSLNEKLEAGLNQGLALKKRVFLNPAKEFTWPALDAPRQDNPAFCHALKQQIAILVDGRVVPCCLDGEAVIELGNLYRESLNQIYQKERTQNILTGFAQGKAAEELCLRCGFRTQFTQKKTSAGF